MVVERSSSPSDMLCGGFLSWNSLRLLHHCGVDPIALGGHMVRKARLFSRRGMMERELPGVSVGLSRKALDNALLDQAASAGAEVRRGVTVRTVEGGTVRFADGTSQTPTHLIWATGKHDVRGAIRPASSKNPSIGLRWRFQADEDLTKDLDGAIELHLFRHGYAGLILQENGFANLCLTVRQSAFIEAGHRPAVVLATLLAQTPVLASRLSAAALEEAQAIANIPYGWHARDDAKHLYRIGDQLGVIPSLAGEGIGIALATGMAAAEAIVAGIAPQAYQDSCAHRIAVPIGIASGLWALAERPCVTAVAFPLLARLPSLSALAMRTTRVNAEKLLKMPFCGKPTR